MRLGSLSSYLRHQLESGLISEAIPLIIEFVTELKRMSTGSVVGAVLEEIAELAQSSDVDAIRSRLPTLENIVRLSALDFLEPGFLGQPQALLRSMRSPFHYAAVAFTSEVLRKVVSYVICVRYSLARSYEHPALLVRDLISLDVKVVADGLYCQHLLGLGMHPMKLIHIGCWALGNNALYGDIGVIQSAGIRRLLDWEC